MLPWMGPLLHHPRLGIVFFGLLIPVAQILFAAVAALLLRANILAAVGNILITNPITFALVLLVAYYLRMDAGTR